MRIRCCTAVLRVQFCDPRLSRGPSANAQACILQSYRIKPSIFLSSNDRGRSAGGRNDRMILKNGIKGDNCTTAFHLVLSSTHFQSSDKIGVLNSSFNDLRISVIRTRLYRCSVASELGGRFVFLITTLIKLTKAELGKLIINHPGVAFRAALKNRKIRYEILCDSSSSGNRLLINFSFFNYTAVGFTRLVCTHPATASYFTSPE